MNNFKLLKGYNINLNQIRGVRTINTSSVENLYFNESNIYWNWVRTRIPEQYIVPERYNHNVEIGTV